MKLIRPSDAMRGSCYICFKRVKGVYAYTAVYEYNGLFTQPPTYKYMNVYGSGRSRRSVDYEIVDCRDDIFMYELDDDEQLGHITC